MELQLSHEEGYVLARTLGPIDETADEVLRAYLHPLVGQRGTRMVIDLEQSPRIDSTGLGLLVKLVCDANTQGSRVVLAALSPFVANILRITRLQRFFVVADDVPQAIQQVLREA